MADKLTTTQAAEQFQIPIRSLQAAIKRGELVAERVDVRGGAYLITNQAMREFAAKWITRRDARRQAAISGEQEIRDC